MRIDLHNHTTYCNHATGSMEEYIERAIELKIDIYGFSEHAPMEFDKGYRLSFEEMRDYENDVLRLREKYKNSIKILLGYEVDYIKGYIDERVLNAKVDYLIGSVHFLNRWGFDNPEFIGGWQNRDIDDIWQDYFNAIRDMAKSGYFDIVGHLDLIKLFKYMPKRDIRVIAEEAFREIKRSDMVIELNSAGLRKPIGEIYPSKYLLSMAYELDIPITLGSDAHAIEQIGFGYDEIKRVAKEVGYTKVVTFQQRDRQLVNF